MKCVLQYAVLSLLLGIAVVTTAWRMDVVEFDKNLDGIIAAHNETAKKLTADRDTYQRELTDSVVMLRKLEGLSFHLHDNETNLIVADVAPMEGSSLNRICSVLNDIVEFQFKQRKRVHWDLEDPEPSLRPMTEEEFQKFLKSLDQTKPVKMEWDRSEDKQ